jgi:hypothetical protein
MAEDPAGAGAEIEDPLHGEGAVGMPGDGGQEHIRISSSRLDKPHCVSPGAALAPSDVDWRNG